MEDTTLRNKILELINAPNYQPIKPKVIAKKLGVSKDEAHVVRRIVKRLAKEGHVAWGGGHSVHKIGAQKPAATSPAGDGEPATAANNRVAPGAGPGKNRVVGSFRRTAKGSGFVRPRTPGVPYDKTQDIFIPPDRTGDAASGDVVLVQVRGRTSHGRRAGEVVDIIERQTHQFVGTYTLSRGAAEVTIDGGLFVKPIPVGDPGAKGAQPDDKVVVEMVRFPTHYHRGEGVIVEVLGKRGEPGIDTLSIIREFNLPGDFPEAALDDAREQAEEFHESLDGRTDLTETTIITIDPVDARDFDDAISLVKLDNGHWRLGVHIADVSHFVKHGTALDREGKDRATSIYLPDRVIPMLPEIISNNLASLQPDKVRYTKTVFIEMTPDGARVSVEPHSAAIKSCRRFTYEEVDEYLDNPKAWKSKLTPEVHALLGRMHELAMILRRRRFERGSLELSMGETEIDLDPRTGNVTGAHVRTNTVSHQIIEEFMLAANEAVAEMFSDRELFFLRRIHSPPDPRKLRDLTEFVRELGIDCESLEDRFEIQRVLAAVKDEPFERAVNYAVLRSMTKAIYGPEEIGHYALASKNYCHFTSPIRRYPDLTVHRMLEAIIAGRTPHSDYEQLVVLGEHCSEREQRAEAAERELIKVKLLSYCAEHIGEEMDAVITGVQDFGIFAQGRQIPAEGLIHVSTLTDDYYDYDSTTHTLAGKKEGNQYRLGDLVRVEIARADIDRRTLDFRLVGLVKHAARPKIPGKRRVGSHPGGKRARGKTAVEPSFGRRGTKGKKKTAATKGGKRSTAKVKGKGKAAVKKTPRGKKRK
jgi:ribonuclease R